MNGNKILIVDDDKRIRSILNEILTVKGFVTSEALGGRHAIKLFAASRPSLALLDLKMPDMDGIETMQAFKEIDPDVPVIIITAHGDVPSAVEAIKLGAYDFILKPPDFDNLHLTIMRAIEKTELEKEVRRLNTVVEASFQNAFGKSGAMQGIIEQIKQIAKSDFSVIIQGETGTGKSFLARAIHDLSTRAKGPFVAVDIGLMPESLIESELFGYERGAFTGAERRKMGFFEIAGGGTILIDELENMSPYMQSKLLRVVEEREIHPLGSSLPLGIDVRIIAAANTDIGRSVREKKFREDLFYRLGEFIVTIPPLRERPDDIPFLAQKFLKVAAEELHKAALLIDEETLNFLKGYSWPGNIRELKNVMRRAALFSDGQGISKKHIEGLVGSDDSGNADARRMPPNGNLSCPSLRELEKAAIIQALSLTGGNKRKTATMLEIDYTTLLRKIKQYGIQ